MTLSPDYLAGFRHGHKVGTAQQRAHDLDLIDPPIKAPDLDNRQGGVRSGLRTQDELIRGSIRAFLSAVPLISPPRLEK